MERVEKSENHKTKKDSVFEIAIYTICCLLGIIAGLIFLVNLDTIPADEADYKDLEEKALAIQQDPNLMFEMECEGKINNKEVEVKLQNSECYVVTQYNENFDIVSMTRHDKSTHIVLAIVLTLIFMVVATAIAFAIVIVLMFIWVFILFLYDLIREKLGKEPVSWKSKGKFRICPYFYVKTSPKFTLK